MQPIDVQSSGITDTGKVRTDNQDHFLIAELNTSLSVRSGVLPCASGSRLFGGPRGHLFLVADGMGGHRGGSEASSFAVQYCANSMLNGSCWYDREDDGSDKAFFEHLTSIFENAHRAIEERSKTAEAFHGMGTTLTMAYVDWPQMFVVHAGDTRCYLFRKNELQLITRDHTVANEMIRKGQLAPEDLERSHWSNVLVNALGAGAESVVPDCTKVDLQRNDSILMCSDGLNKHVSDVQIRRVLLDAKGPQNVCEELVALAKQGGGSDNITVVMATFHTQQNHRMQMFMSPPGKEAIVQDVETPATELDTCDLEGTPLGSTTSETDEDHGVRETLDFNDYVNPDTL
jgi:PPM family protein phosphatase